MRDILIGWVGWVHCEFVVDEAICSLGVSANGTEWLRIIDELRRYRCGAKAST